ncbi:MAG: hypothetical protein L0Y48_04775 [Fusobacteria bacterium]|nr:hypothetical protein [Fusobacteriota bacterium]
MLVIKGKYLLTKDGLKKDHGLVINNGIITDIQPNNMLTSCTNTQAICCDDSIIVPGFINAHTHMYGTISGCFFVNIKTTHKKYSNIKKT